MEPASLGRRREHGEGNTSVGTSQNEIASRVESLKRQGRPAPLMAGEPFSHLINLKVDNGDLDFQLPKSSWAAALSFPLFKDPDMGFGMTVCALIIPCFINLAITVAVQSIYVVYIREITLDMEPICTEEHALLRVICLGTLVAVIYAGDVKETITMARWLDFVPSWDEVEHRASYSQFGSGLLFKKLTDIHSVCDWNNSHLPYLRLWDDTCSKVMPGNCSVILLCWALGVFA